ncbi:hypothetical protein ASPWEDRAFT_41140 [Aspergillus wentii DTO 134E9]|uniref:Uncharacterized protein n=1 Tax=Aspergillus wentii DTO 134E9 TaxID=1073089 RepID=A0A1L9RLT3_ASPWE|nr:uncharacterized protein ASPWEDRAFT_41140 [Aspergillus wentii DTO 134E9]OJJ35910.1 hypothetical protein ASPWEDRAFT_41140 [Aspergillus wentii DTO 134E9]
MWISIQDQLQTAEIECECFNGLSVDLDKLSIQKKFKKLMPILTTKWNIVKYHHNRQSIMKFVEDQ